MAERVLTGELAQRDLWFPPVDVPLGFGQVGRPPVVVMVTGYSRWMNAVMLPSRQSPDRLAGHWTLLNQLGAVPRALVWDNESAVGSWRGGRPKLTEDFERFRLVGECLDPVRARAGYSRLGARPSSPRQLPRDTRSQLLAAYGTDTPRPPKHPRRRGRARG